MLSMRSKVLITVASLICLLLLLNYVLDLGAWAREPVENWYLEWIVIGACVVVAAVSIAFDLRLNG